MKELFYKVHRDLPIFGIEQDAVQILYTPGYFLVLKHYLRNEILQYFKNPNAVKQHSTRDQIKKLIKVSKQNINRWLEESSKQFDPKSLTIHVGSECNFDCLYCFSKYDPQPNLKGFPSLDIISEAAKLLVKNKKCSPSTVTVVYHGSGEPTLHWKQLRRTHEWISQYFRKSNLELFSYIATNGNISKKQASWLAKNISRIGISCDGPPCIERRLRRSKNIIKNDIIYISKILTMEGGNVDVRTTISPSSMSRQLEVVSYILDNIKPHRIMVEPVYLVGDGFQVDDAEEFYANFKLSQKYALSKGVDLFYSGVRLDEIHGPFCEAARDNLRITPDGIVRNCFCRFDASQFGLGHVSRFLLPSTKTKLQEDRTKAFSLPEECLNCINVFHCSRGCPDFCAYTVKSSNVEKLNQFKCRLNQMYSVDQIIHSVDRNQVEYV